MEDLLRPTGCDQPAVNITADGELHPVKDGNVGPHANLYRGSLLVRDR